MALRQREGVAEWHRGKGTVLHNGTATKGQCDTMSIRQMDNVAQWHCDTVTYTCLAVNQYQPSSTQPLTVPTELPQQPPSGWPGQETVELYLHATVSPHSVVSRSLPVPVP